MSDSVGDQRKAGRWGRAWKASLLARVSTLALIVVAPLLVFYFYLSCVSYGGALSGPIVALATGRATLGTLWHQLPNLTWDGVWIAVIWVAFQVVLALWVPDILHKFLPGYRGGKRLGAVTPAGERLSYQINGLQVWVISHVLFGLGGYAFGWWSPTIIADNWGSLLWVANIAGVALALFVYMKAHLFPTSAAGRKFSGNVIYDFFMGIEHNPRIGKFDFKLFFNGRPGIIAWTMINWSFAAYQWANYGYVTNSMILVNLLQAIYVLDFFWNESWYLNTIDIAHDHFGWMLAWGDSVWLPWMYTLQAFYLAYNPVILSTPYALFILFLGLGAYGLMRWANAQKDLFRRTGGDCKIWGKQAEKIEATYTSGDGKVHKSNLMVAGWWRIARHTNYLGDILGSLAYCLACGFYNVLPYFYVIYMTILLVHRSLRDEHRCHHKYGAAWEEYCRRVPYRIIPGIF